MTRYLLMMVMVILTPPKGSGGLPHAPRPAVVEARVWDKLAAALSFVESRDDDRAYNASSGALGRWQMKRIYVDEVNRILRLKGRKGDIDTKIERILSRLGRCSRYINLIIILKRI